MKPIELMKTHPLQVFRARVYLPFLNLFDIMGDLLRGVSTQKVIELSELDIDPDVGTRCETVSYRKRRQALIFARNLGFDSFLDIGCGMGRPLIVADELGFNDLYGVDISPTLIRIAQNNFNKRNASVSLSCSDVDNFIIPSGRLAIWLFNPFGKERMTRLISKLQNRQSETLVIYHNPKFHSCFDKSHKVRSITWLHFGLYEEVVEFYLIPANHPS